MRPLSILQLRDRPKDVKGRTTDVLERPYTAAGGGGTPAGSPCPPPPILPFQCLRLTARIFLRRLRCQEDLSTNTSTKKTLKDIVRHYQPFTHTF